MHPNVIFHDRHGQYLYNNTYMYIMDQRPRMVKDGEEQ